MQGSEVLTAINTDTALMDKWVYNGDEIEN